MVCTALQNGLGPSLNRFEILGFGVGNGAHAGLAEHLMDGLFEGLGSSSEAWFSRERFIL